MRQHARVQYFRTFPDHPPNFELTERAIRVNAEICRRPLIKKDQLHKLFPDISPRPFDQIVSNLFRNGFIARPRQQQELHRNVKGSFRFLSPVWYRSRCARRHTDAFDQYLWYRWPLHASISKRPYIHGTWKARLVSDYIDPETSKQIDPINGYVSIHQTYSSLSFRIYTDKSSSFLITHAIDPLNGGQYRIATVYQNDPKFEQRGRVSEIHYGALRLDAGGLSPATLSGEYWTDLPEAHSN